MYPKQLMFVYISRVYSMVQSNPRPKDDLIEAENVRSNINQNFWNYAKYGNVSKM